MKKDYVPVSVDDSKLSEPRFVGQYWTRIWNERDVPDHVAEKVESREEFSVVAPYFSNLTPDSRILDGGCGLGEWTLYYGSKSFRVVGLDLSRETIEKLTKRFPNHNFITGDIRRTEFRACCFDAYFSWGTFEHFEEGLGPPLREARRILKPGGYLFISVPFQNGRLLRRDRRELYLWDEHYDRHKRYQSEMRFYQWRLTKSELQRELEVNGFNALQIQAIHKSHGLYRTIKHDFHIDPDSRLGIVLRILLYPFFPKAFVAHSLIAAAQKA